MGERKGERAEGPALDVERDGEAESEPGSGLERKWGRVEEPMMDTDGHGGRRGQERASAAEKGKGGEGAGMRGKALWLEAKGGDGEERRGRESVREDGQGERAGRRGEETRVGGVGQRRDKRLSR